MHHTPMKTIGYVTEKNQLPSMTSTRSHHLKKTSNVNWRANSIETQFTKISQAYNVTHLMVD